MKLTDSSKLKKILIDFKAPSKVYAVDSSSSSEEDLINSVEIAQTDLGFCLYAIIPNEKIEKHFQEATDLIDKAVSINDEGFFMISCWQGKNESLVIVYETPDCQITDELNNKWKFNQVWADESNLDENDFYDNDGEFYEASSILKKKICEALDLYIPPSKDLTGKIFCFTGFRDKETEEIIKSLGGTIQNAVNKNLSYLVCNNIEKESVKVQKAQELEVEVISFVKLIRQIL